ncbi:MAG: ankyrin repeat domain-containing protein [Alphaproteobacteria bacterium]|nr:MAG: ankyrin repeat domain-containing protein [Alphaproteobacteria bacterium]
MGLAPEKLTNMLVTAILRGDHGGIASILSMGANPNLSDAKGNTPLMIAATDPRDHGSLKALIAAKVDPNVPNANGALPLHAVLRMKDERPMLAAINILLAGKANPNLGERRPDGVVQTPLQLALALNRNDMVIETLMRGGADPCRGEHPLLHAMAREGRYGLLEAAHAGGADMNYQDADGMTCLMHAARAGAARTVEILLECGADPTLLDKNGENAIAHACAAPADSDFKPVIKMMQAAANDYVLRKEMRTLRGELASLRAEVDGLRQRTEKAS